MPGTPGPAVMTGPFAGLPSLSTGFGNPYIDTRAIDKTPKFSGQNEMFDSWAFTIKGYMALMGLITESELEIIQQSKTPMLTSNMNSTEKAKSHAIYYILIQLLKDKAQKVIRSRQRLSGMADSVEAIHQRDRGQHSWHDAGDNELQVRRQVGRCARELR